MGIIEQSENLKYVINGQVNFTDGLFELQIMNKNGKYVFNEEEYDGLRNDME